MTVITNNPFENAFQIENFYYSLNYSYSAKNTEKLITIQEIKKVCMMK